MGVQLIPIAEFGGAGGRLWAKLRDEFEKPLVKLPAEDTWRRLPGIPTAFSGPSLMRLLAYRD